MDYVILNSSGKVYIRLDLNGKPETCTKQMRQRFEYSKAMNILDNLPKTMKMYRFNVVPELEEIVAKEEKNKSETILDDENISKSILRNANYIVSDEIKDWMERVHNYNSLVKDARKRKDELNKALSNIDKERCNSEHKIELEKDMGVCGGYMEYRNLRTVLRKRRTIKDELYVINMILDSNSMISDENIDGIVQGLVDRVYGVREVV